MGRKAETSFREQFTKRLKEVPNCWFESIQQKTIHGTPDKMGVINGLFVALEFKESETAHISALQTLKLRNIANAGGIALVVYPKNATKTLEYLKKLGEKNASTELETDKRGGLHEGGSEAGSQ